MVRMKQGFLMKNSRNQSGAFKALGAKPQKRYVVLKWDELQYFENDKLGTPMKGTFSIGPETEAEIKGTELHVKNSEEVIVFYLVNDGSLQNEGELESWRKGPRPPAGKRAASF